MVTLGDIYADLPAGCSPLTAWLGKDISGHGVACDLARMPHLLIAGTTGSGKSGCINAMLCSILLRATPDEVRMILVDPKRVELNHYESIPHLLTPVVTNMKNAALVLQNIVREMESRYELMGAAKARNLGELNRARGRRGAATPLPHMLVVIDELADLMMVSPAEVEDAIIRLAQKSRAVGIHLVLATQRPRVDVITGMIKANVPVADRLRRVVADRLARDPRRQRRRGAARPGRHALQAARHLASCSASRAPTSPRRRRAQHRRAPAAARASRRSRRSCSSRRPTSSRSSWTPDEDPVLERRHPAGRAAPDRLGLAAAAPPARRLHARRAA